MRGEQLKRQDLQRVSRQDGGRLVEGLVAGRPAPPQVVIVHGRQVVVHERVAMDQFDGTGRGVDAVRAARPASPRSHRRGQAGCACRDQARCSAGPRAAGWAPRPRPAATRPVRARRATRQRSRACGSALGRPARRWRARSFVVGLERLRLGVDRFVQQDFDFLLGLLAAKPGMRAPVPRRARTAAARLRAQDRRARAFRRSPPVPRGLFRSRRSGQAQRAAGAVFASRMVSGARKPCTGVGTGQRASREVRAREVYQGTARIAVTYALDHIGGVLAPI